MSRKPRFRFYSTFALISLLLCGAFLGCAKDAAPFHVVLNPGPRFAAETPKNTEFSTSSKPTIQQTSFQSKIPDPTWHDSLTEAIADAQTNDKLILADFTGSDWCHWCVKLKQEIFETDDFKNWANENVVLLELDYPRKSTQSPEIKRQNEVLKSRYNISSYPTVLLLDVEGNVLAKIGYERGKSASQWVQLAESRLQEESARASTTANRPSGSMTR